MLFPRTRKWAMATDASVPLQPSLSWPPPNEEASRKWTGWDLNPEHLRMTARPPSISRHLSASAQMSNENLDFTSWTSESFPGLPRSCGCSR